MSWASITPFGVPVVPDVKTSSKIVVGPRARPGVELGLPVGREGRRPGRRSASSRRRRRELAQPGLARVGRVAAGAERSAASPRPGRRSARSRRAPSAGRAGRARGPRASRRSTRRAARASTATRSGSGRRAARPSARRRHAAIRLRRWSSAYVQRDRRAVVAAQAERGSIAVAPGRLLEEVDERLHPRMVAVRRSRLMVAMRDAEVGQPLRSHWFKTWSTRPRAPGRSGGGDASRLPRRDELEAGARGQAMRAGTVGVDDHTSRVPLLVA